MVTAPVLLTWPVLVSVIVGGVTLIMVLHYSAAWRRPSKSGSRLPPGSFGWPVIGDTLHFARNPGGYVSSKAKRHGTIFKSSLFLGPMIVGTSPEFVKFVLSNPSLFVVQIPESLRQLTGPKAFGNRDGPEHLAIKKIITKALVPEALRTKVNVLEAIIVNHLAAWARKGTVNAFESTSAIVVDTSLALMLGVTNIGSTPEGREVVKQFRILEHSFLSLPVNLPGTQFNKGLKAKAALTAYFKYLLGKRKNNQENNDDQQENDVLGVLSAAQEDPQARAEVKDLGDDAVADNLTFVWFAAYTTTRTTLTWILKFLVDHPDESRRVQAEQQEICRGKDIAEKPRLTVDDTKKMIFTSKFFQELQRIVSLAPGVFRKATRDVEFDGYLIPKGWAVSPMNVNIHKDHAIYPDPLSFNPERFDVPPKPFTYLPFSAGTHMCPGLDTVKLVSLVYIHHLTTTYTFESAGPDQGVDFSPVPTPKGGYPIIVRRQNSIQ